MRLVQIIHACNTQNEACYLNALAQKLNLSHVAVKRHLDLLVEEGYVREVNPNGKPVYVELTKKGLEVVEEFRKNES